VIETAGVVVPARNEETLLPACLSALRRAARQVSIPVRVLVAADSCTDRTAEVARAYGARVIRVRARSVGAARAAGMTELLRLTAGSDPAAVWLATTDADTVVPPHWLRRQVSHAGQGWDVVLGTVTVADWSEHPPDAPAVFAARYESGDRPHAHVHGANIGIRASAYRAAGGFRPLRTAEDHALLAAAAAAGCSVLPAGDVTVETSGRKHARAPHGFSHLLGTLAPAPQAGLHESVFQARVNRDDAVHAGERDNAGDGLADHGQPHLTAVGSRLPGRGDQGVQPGRIAEPGAGHVDDDQGAAGPGPFEQGRPQAGGVGEVDLLGRGHDRHALDHLDREADLRHCATSWPRP
jgi:hypothetical protein